MRAAVLALVAGLVAAGSVVALVAGMGRRPRPHRRHADLALPRRGELTMTQPVGIGAAVVVFVNSVLAMLVMLDVIVLDEKQVAAVNLVVVNGVALIAALYAWWKSTPVSAPTLKEGTQVKVTDATGTRIGTTTVSSD